MSKKETMSTAVVVAEEEKGPPFGSYGPPQFIKGPVSLVEYRYQERKGPLSRWYLFGDWHVRDERKCPDPHISIKSFIHDALSDTMYGSGERPVDLIVEARSDSTIQDWHRREDWGIQGLTKQGYLFGEVNEMAHHLRHMEQGIKHVHLIDVRPIIRNSMKTGVFRMYAQLEEMTTHLRDTLQSSIAREIDIEKPIATERWSAIRRDMSDLASWMGRYEQATSEELMNQVLKESKLDSGLHEIENRSVQIQIRKWIRGKLSRPLKTLRKMLRFYRRHRSLLGDDSPLYKKIDPYLELYRLAAECDAESTSLFSLWQDLATLIKLFGGNQGHPLRSAILYLGNAHVNNISEFFDSRRIPGLSKGFHAPGDSGDRQCVDISKLPSRLFPDTATRQGGQAGLQTLSSILLQPLPSWFK